MASFKLLVLVLLCLHLSALSRRQPHQFPRDVMRLVSLTTIVDDAFADNLPVCLRQHSLDEAASRSLLDDCADVTGKHPPRVLFRGSNNPDIICSINCGT